MSRLLLSVLLFIVAASSHAQVGFGIEIPDASAISLSSESVVFNLAEQGFPPPAFPHHYLPSEPAEPLLVRLYSNLDSGWILEADFSAGLLNEAGHVLLPAQLEYRFDGGPWLEFASTVALYSSQGRSDAFEEHTLELRLQLLGNEAPGRYQGVLNFTFVQF